ncbi:hypothetical protein E5288_WYG014204 [Bos mutus]|uniref:Uncharacterized protein n=1 Tax=Bos mutus TaxID=72004 RepID=A0A6B0R2V1_9CETA|nr:hypothetical protein [Bos mutus]
MVTAKQLKLHKPGAQHWSSPEIDGLDGIQVLSSQISLNSYKTMLEKSLDTSVPPLQGDLGGFDKVDGTIIFVIGQSSRNVIVGRFLRVEGLGWGSKPMVNCA